MVLAEVGQGGGFDARAAKPGGQEVECGIDVVGEGPEAGAGGDGAASVQSGFKRHYGVNQAVRVGQDRAERGETGGVDTGLGGEAGERSLQVRPGEAAMLAGAV